MHLTKTLAPAFTAIAALLTGCVGVLSPVPITGSGNHTSLNKTATGFTSVAVGHGCEATVRRGDIFSVQITIDDNLADFVHVEQNGAALDIHLEHSRIYTNYTFRADITLPDVEGLNASGGSVIDMQGFDVVHAVTLELSGGSKATGEIACGNLAVNGSGGSTATLTGSAADLSITASGGSKALLKDMAVNGANVNLSGGSRAEVKTDGTLSGELSGGSHLFYRGMPTLGRINTSGGSTVSAL